MRSLFHILSRLARGLVFFSGVLFLFIVLLQFTPYPWRAYKSLAVVPAPCHKAPSHILVMGGSGIPGESGLSRTFFGARAAHLYPDADVLIAMPLDTNESFASRAYLDEFRLRGVAAERVRILANGRNTREQALRMAEILAGKTNLFHVLIVTDTTHIRRTAACLRKACALKGVAVHLDGMPAFQLSIEDPVEFVARDLDDHESPAPAARAVIPDIGASLNLRYNLWVNLSYTQAAWREYSALLYYRLRGWI